MGWTAPAWSVPVQSVEPVEAVVAATQHGPLAEIIRRYELEATG